MPPHKHWLLIAPFFEEAEFFEHTVREMLRAWLFTVNGIMACGIVAIAMLNALAQAPNKKDRHICEETRSPSMALEYLS